MIRYHVTYANSYTDKSYDWNTCIIKAYDIEHVYEKFYRDELDETWVIIDIKPIQK